MELVMDLLEGQAVVLNTPLLLAVVVLVVLDLIIHLLQQTKQVVEELEDRAVLMELIFTGLVAVEVKVGINQLLLLVEMVDLAAEAAVTELAHMEQVEAVH
jgi:hypothetical protein